MNRFDLQMLFSYAKLYLISERHYWETALITTTDDFKKNTCKENIEFYKKELNKVFGLYEKEFDK